MERQKIILVDFDGVIHSYSSGWQGIATIPDRPVDGAIEFLTSLVEDPRFDVCIYSSRSRDPDGREAMRRWLQEWGMNGATLINIRFPEIKPAAWITIDDRAFHFQGTYPTLEEIDNFKPWNKQ